MEIRKVISSMKFAALLKDSADKVSTDLTDLVSLRLLLGCLCLMPSLIVSSAYASSSTVGSSVEIRSIGPRKEISPTAQSHSLHENGSRQTASEQNAVSRESVLRRLKEMQKTYGAKAMELENSIKQRLQESTEVKLSTQELRLIDQRIKSIGEELTALKTRHAEVIARRDFINQLIFAVDTKWSSQPMKAFMEHQLLDMADNDLSDPRSQGRMWKFLTYLSIAIREIPDPREDLLAFIEGYMNYSSVLDPKTPTEFIANHDYTNGTMSVAAQPQSKDRIGDGIEKKLQALRESGLLETASSAQAESLAAPQALPLTVPLEGPAELRMRVEPIESRPSEAPATVGDQVSAIEASTSLDTKARRVQ